jgi:hypothetical protein
MVARKSCSPVLSGGVPRRRCGTNWVSFPPMSNFAQSPEADGAMFAVATIPLLLLLLKMKAGTIRHVVPRGVISIVNFFYTVINQYK